MGRDHKSAARGQYKQPQQGMQEFGGRTRGSNPALPRSSSVTVKGIELPSLTLFDKVSGALAVAPTRQLL